MFVSHVSSAQSPRPDIAWFAGGHPEVISVAYSPDGKILASSGHFADTIKLWRASDGSMIRSLRTNAGANLFIFGPMVPVTFFPDGQNIIALGEGAGPAFWSAADGNFFRKLSIGGSDLALNRDGSLIAVAANTSIKLARPNDGAVVRTIPWPSDFVQKVAFSSNGRVVAGGDRAGMLRTFRVADGSPLLTIPAHNDYINALGYSPDGTRIATGSSDTTVKLWNATSGKPISTLSGHTNDVLSIAFSPDGALLASGSYDNTVKLWAMPNGTLSGTLSQPREVDSLAFNPTSTRLAVAAYSELREWDVASQTLIRNLVRATDQISGTIFTPDNAKLVSASYDGKISISDVATGALLNQIAAGQPGGAIFDLAANADLIAAGVNVPNVVKIYRLSDGALLHTLFPGSQAYIRSAVFSPDGAILVTGHFGNFARVWHVADGSLVRTLGEPGFSGDMNGLAYTSDGSVLLSGSSDGLVRVWDGQGALVRSMSASGQSISSIAISPDNQFVLAGGDQARLELWRIDNGALVYSATANSAITTVCFTPSGFAFYAALGDRTLRVYRTSDHQLLETYNIEAGEGPGGISGVGKVTSLGISSDGKRVSYGRDDATVVMAYNSLIAAPTSAVAAIGQIVKGSFADLIMPDGKRLAARPTQGDQPGLASLQLDIGAHSPLTNPGGLSFQIVVSGAVDGIQQQIWMRNAQTKTLELVDARNITTSEQTVRVDLGPNFARFIDLAGNVSARLKYSSFANDWNITVDQAIWAAGL